MGKPSVDHLWHCPHCDDHHDEPVCYTADRENGSKFTGEMVDATGWARCDNCLRYCRQGDSHPHKIWNGDIHDSCPSCSEPVHYCKCNGCGRVDDSFMFANKTKTAYKIVRECQDCGSTDVVKHEKHDVSIVEPSKVTTEILAHTLKLAVLLRDTGKPDLGVAKERLQALVNSFYKTGGALLDSGLNSDKDGVLCDIDVISMVIDIIDDRIEVSGSVD